MPGATAPEELSYAYAYACAAVALFVYAVGSIACFFLPEPTREMRD